MINWVYDDGGRGDAGYRGSTGDCCARAFAIAAKRPYQEVYDRINELATAERPSKRRTRSNARTGVHRPVAHRVAAAYGMVWVPKMGIGTGCTVHLTADELPEYGRYVLSLTKHYAALVDGTVRDTFLDDRDGTRCVYGWWKYPTLGSELQRL
jgi:hypothetical protein